MNSANPVDVDREAATDGAAPALFSSAPNSVEPGAHHHLEFARCYLRLANLPNFALDRLSRYEATLWRQVRQTLLALDALDHQTTGKRAPFGQAARSAGLRMRRLLSCRNTHLRDRRNSKIAHFVGLL
jgi:hypothetical protein